MTTLFDAAKPGALEIANRTVTAPTTRAALRTWPPLPLAGIRG